MLPTKVMIIRNVNQGNFVASVNQNCQYLAQAKYH